MPSATERSILTSPGPVARAASHATREPEQRWMLTQPREIRRDFAEEVFGREDADLRQEVWMLRQPKAVRESRLAELADRDLAASPSDGAVRFSEDYERGFRQVRNVTLMLNALILIAIFLMVTKPGV